MERLWRFLLPGILFFSLNITAQQPGDTEPIASNRTWKGKRELRRQEKRKQNEKKHMEKLQRKAAKKSREVTKKRMLHRKMRRIKKHTKEE